MSEHLGMELAAEVRAAVSNRSTQETLLRMRTSSRKTDEIRTRRSSRSSTPAGAPGGRGSTPGAAGGRGSTPGGRGSTPQGPGSTPGGRGSTPAASGGKERRSTKIGLGRHDSHHIIHRASRSTITSLLTEIHNHI